MTEQFITFATAKLARSKGYDEKDTHVYFEYATDKGILRKSHYATSQNSDIDFGCSCTGCQQSLLQKWLRERHRIDVEAYSCAGGYNWTLAKSFNSDYFSGGTHIADSDMTGPNNAGGWDTYEEALEAGLTNALIRIK